MKIEGNEGASQGVDLEALRKSEQERIEHEEEIQGVVEARKGITSQRNMPDIRMEMNPEEALRRQKEDEAIEKELSSSASDNEKKDKDLFYADSRYAKIHDDLELLYNEKYRIYEHKKNKEGKNERTGRKATEDERKEAKERLGENREMLMRVQLEAVEDILDDNFLRLRSSYPYDARSVSMLYESMRKSLRATRKEKWVNKTPEARVWLDSIALDMDWGENNFKILEGVGTILPSFYGGTGMMAWVSGKFRTDPVASFYQHTFAKEVPGLKINKEMATKEGVELTREKAITYQDEAMFWKIAVVEVQQMDFSKSNVGEPSMMKNEAGGEVLSKEEIELIQLVFGEKEKGEWVTYKGEGLEHGGVSVPKSILNWYTMNDSLENKQRYIATMEALLVLGIKDELKSDSVVNLAKKVQDYLYGEGYDPKNGEMKGRLGEWSSVEKSLDQRLAGVVVKSGITMDLGHMSSGRLSWGWSYEEEYKKNTDGSDFKDVNGKKIVERIKRKKGGGGTTVATDISTPRNWLSTEAGNQDKNWTKGMLPPMSTKYREMIKENAEGWQPKLEGVGGYELKGKQKKMWDRLWDGLDGEKDAKTKKMMETLKGMAYYIETPYKDEDGEKLMVPMFFPAEIKSLNFWETLKLKPETEEEKEQREARGEDKKKVTVWDEVTAGGNMSNVKWEKMGNQALYKWMITISQTLKFFTVMSEPEKRVNGDQFGDFFGSPGQLTELIKRVDLGVRDEKEEKSVMVMSLAPMLVAMKLVDKNNILSGSLYHDSKSRFETRRELWLERVAEWLPAFEDLVEEKGDFEGYNQMMKKMYVFYISIFTEIGVAAGKSENNRKIKSYEDLKEEVKSVLPKFDVPDHKNITDNNASFPEIRK